jgi:hypothetical protein
LENQQTWREENSDFFNLLFFRIFHIFSLFNLPFFHMFHIISQFNLLFFRMERRKFWFQKIIRNNETYGRSVSWIAKRYGKYRRKASW